MLLFAYPESRLCCIIGMASSPHFFSLYLLRYDFKTPFGERVVMSVAAKAGKIFVCGASAAPDKFGQYSDELAKAVTSFRLNDPVPTA